MNNLQLRVLSCLLIFSGLNGCAGHLTTSGVTAVHLHRSNINDWSVRYVLPEKTRQIEFARNPEIGRKDRWTPIEAQFEIVRLNGKDIARRTDRRAFDHIEFKLTPTYQHLGKDYAPFSSYSDGGLLIHTGRYFACPDTCDNKEPEWQFSLTDRLSQHVLVHGELQSKSAKWIDSKDGTVVYIGQRKPVETRRAWVLIDPAFPTDMANLLGENLPEMVDYFAKKFGELPRKPTFFASYDRDHANSSGSQGGTLPDQIFMHFFGESLAQKLQNPNYDLWLSWFFAHEVSHLYQTEAGEKESWVHEGSAEAFAAIVLRNWSDRSRLYVNARRKKALTECREGLRTRPLESAAEQNDFQLYYSCGLILHLALDEAIRQNDGGLDGLFAIWKAYESELAGGSEPNGATFRFVLSRLGGTRLADWTSQFTTKPAPELSPANY